MAISILSTERLGHKYSDHWLFRDLSFGLQKGERVALVGANGTGKSTLLQLLSGMDPLEGKVVKEKGIRIGTLPQNPDFQGVVSIYDFIYSVDNEQQRLIREYEELLAQPDPSQQKLAELSDQLTATDAWEYEHNIKSILHRLQITDFSQEINTLSGGQRKRLALAKLLIDDPDVYLLDEPTNHLDIETIEWLEKWFTSGQKTVLLVTHDRYFLDQVCTAIRELDGGQLYSYVGNYRYYLEKKAERDAASQTLLERNRNLLRRELEWMRRQPKARGTKSKARIDAFHVLDEQARQSASQDSVQLQVKVSRQGKKILELTDVSKRFGDREIISDFSYVFKKGDRIGLAGQNGSGKSTLLNLITGELAPDKGVVTRGETTVFGYYQQRGLSFNESDRVIDLVTDVADYITMADGTTCSASQLLTQFLFPPKKQFGLVAKLSGGERKRLLLMRVLMQNPNFLILDEPTNDLDIDTLNVLESFLLNYPGILVLVSHDRYLLDKLTEQLFILKGDGQVAVYNGNYADYKQSEEALRSEKKTAVAVSPTPRTTPAETKNKLTYKERMEFEELDAMIPLLEKTIGQRTEALNKTSDHLAITEIAEELAKLNYDLEAKTERWLMLSEHL